MRLRVLHRVIGDHLYRCSRSINTGRAAADQASRGREGRVRNLAAEGLPGPPRLTRTRRLNASEAFSRCSCSREKLADGTPRAHVGALPRRAADSITRCGCGPCTGGRRQSSPSEAARAFFSLPARRAHHPKREPSTDGARSRWGHRTPEIAPRLQLVRQPDLYWLPRGRPGSGRQRRFFAPPLPWRAPANARQARCRRAAAQPSRARSGPSSTELPGATALRSVPPDRHPPAGGIILSSRLAPSDAGSLGSSTAPQSEQPVAPDASR